MTELQQSRNYACPGNPDNTACRKGSWKSTRRKIFAMSMLDQLKDDTMRAEILAKVCSLWGWYDDKDFAGQPDEFFVGASFPTVVYAQLRWLVEKTGIPGSQFIRCATARWLANPVFIKATPLGVPVYKATMLAISRDMLAACYRWVSFKNYTSIDYLFRVALETDLPRLLSLVKRRCRSPKTLLRVN